MHNPTRKRKAIDDFFTPTKRRFESPDSTRGTQLSRTDKALKLARRDTAVPGLCLCRYFISPTEEQDIVAFLNDPSKCTWRTDLSRRTMHFGGTYCILPSKREIPVRSKPEVLQAPEMPQDLHWLVQRFVDSGVYGDGRRPQFCIVNEYTGNLGISAHTENFQFGEPVVGLGLLSACPIRFHELAEAFDGSVRSGKAAQARKTGRVVDIQLPSRSLLIMSGPSRWSWQHEIVNSAKGRGPGWKREALSVGLFDARVKETSCKLASQVQPRRPDAYQA
ncbi:MAG: hypothetical protein Q9173_005421 [Seirophora scorigena]